MCKDSRSHIPAHSRHSGRRDGRNHYVVRQPLLDVRSPRCGRS
jgi:hypothetical protein